MGELQGPSLGWFGAWLAPWLLFVRTMIRTGTYTIISLYQISSDYSIIGLLLVFPCLTALSVHFIFRQSGLSRLSAQCTTTSYTGLGSIDTPLCGLVTFFQTLMASPTHFSFLKYFSGNGAPFVVLPIVEAYRTGQSRLLAYPLIWGLASQLFTMAVTTTVYCFVFLLLGGVERGRKSDIRLITQADAEAIVFGIIAGAVIPTVAMMVLQDPYVTAMWQLYPAYVAIGHFLHLLFRPASRYSQSGHRTIQALFIGSFIVSSSTHISIVWPMINDYDTLREFFIPSISMLDPSTDLSLQVLELLQWDFAFSFVSVAVTSLWFASNLKQFIGIIAWYIGAIPTIGFGAAVIGVAIWRDNVL